jgi:hypothetical protein
LSLINRPNPVAIAVTKGAIGSGTDCEVAIEKLSNPLNSPVAEVFDSKTTSMPTTSPSHRAAM